MAEGLCPLFRSRAEVVHGFRIGVGLEQQIYELAMSTDGRSMQRGGVADSTARVDIGAVLDEQSSNFCLAARGRFVERCPPNPGRVDRGSRRTSGVNEKNVRFEESLNGGNVAVPSTPRRCRRRPPSPPAR